MTQVRNLCGEHLGQYITVNTRHTKATGVLQGFRHDTDTINDSGFGGESWASGKTRTTITLLPDQRIVATMEDDVVVHESKLNLSLNPSHDQRLNFQNINSKL